MKIKIKNQERKFFELMTPGQFVCENVDNLEDIYAEENNITSGEVHNLQLNYRAEMQTTVIGKMVECYEAFILLNY